MVAQLFSMWPLQEDIPGFLHYGSRVLRQQALQVSTCIIFADILLAQASPTPEGTIPGVEVTMAVKTTTRHMQYTAGALTRAYVSLRVRVQGSFAAHISPSAL